MAIQGYVIKRDDFSGGMNTRNSPDDVDNNQCVNLRNLSVDGKGLITTPGYTEYIPAFDSRATIKGIAQDGEIVVFISALEGSYARLYVYNTRTFQFKTIDMDYVRRPHITIWLDKIIVCDYVSGIFAYDFDRSFVNDIVVKSFTNIPPNKSFSCSTVFQNRLFICQYYYYTGVNPRIKKPTVVYWSNISDGLTTDTILNFSGVSSGFKSFNNEITGIVSGQDYLHISTTEELFRISGVEYTYRQETVTGTGGSTTTQVIESSYINPLKVTSTGNINPFSIIPVMQDVFYFDKDNVRRISYETFSQALQDVAISENIFQTIQKAGIQNNSFAWFTYPYYKIAICEDSEFPNFVLIYNIVEKSWSTGDLGLIHCACSGKSDRTGKSEGLLGGAMDGAIYLDNVSIGDTTSYIESRHFNFGDKVKNKRLIQCTLGGEIYNSTATIDFYADGNIIGTYTISNVDENLQPTIGSENIGSNAQIGSTGAVRDDTVFEEIYEFYAEGRTFWYTITVTGLGTFRLEYDSFTYKPILALKKH